MEVVLSILAACVSIVSLYLARRSLIHSHRVGTAELLLRLEELIIQHQGIHLRLRGGGDWTERGAGPNSSNEWAEVDDYLGFFELLDRLIDLQVLSIEEVRTFYGYRYDNIISNQVIKEYIDYQVGSWDRFNRLGRRLKDPSA